MAHILIVDDESTIITVLQEMLVRLGYDVLTAIDGNQALNLISSGNIDLVITDIVMPNMDGIELISQLKEKFPALKIVAISGGGAHDGPEGYLRKAQDLGVDRCLTKPFMLSELSAIVKELIAE